MSEYGERCEKMTKTDRCDERVGMKREGISNRVKSEKETDVKGKRASVGKRARKRETGGKKRERET